jgi:threonine aldolase
MHDCVDLRADTVTRPSAQMRRAMAEAELGDDVLGDDPTVQRLQRVAAERMGTEAALFVPSGTMSNSIAIRVHTRPGDEILLDWDAHSMRYEVGAPAVLSGVVTRTFRSDLGVPDVDQIADEMHPASLHAPGTSLLVLENTHNVAGGTVVPLEVHRDLYRLARERGVRVHIDGARIFNAATAAGVPASQFAACADSITFCLSKGLGCPVGSVLCGTRDFIGQALRVRKQLGGGMRQSGLLAACGLVALDTMIERLAEDHVNASRLALGISSLPGIIVDMRSVQTNMVYALTRVPAAELAARLAEARVLCLALAPHRVRLVTHVDVDADDIDRALAAFREATA